MIIRWIRERQYSDFGLIESDEVINTKKRGIPDEVARKWIADEFAEEVKPEKGKSKKQTEVKENG